MDGRQPQNQRREKRQEKTIRIRIRNNFHAPEAPVKRRVRGASSIEYILILAVVVIPVALLTPMLMRAIVNYAGRIAWAIRSPLG